MPQIQLSVSEAVEITFKDTDGLITVAYTHHAVRSLVGCDIERAMQTPEGISIHVDLPDRAGREGIIYHEPFGNIVLDEDNNPVKPMEPQPEVWFSIQKARQLVSDLELAEPQDCDPKLLMDAQGQLKAAADLLEGLIKGINAKDPTEQLTLLDVKRALQSGKL